MLAEPEMNIVTRPHLCSPPRIKRLQDCRAERKNIYAEIRDEKEGLPQYSAQSPLSQTLATSSESESLLSIQLSSKSLSQPSSSSLDSYGDIAVYRRRLKTIQERRARHQNQPEEDIPFSQKQVEIKVGPENRPIAHQLNSESPLTMNETVKMETDDDAWGSHSIDSHFPQNISTISTCRTFDETTMDLSTNATNSWQEFSPAHVLLSPSSPITSSNNANRTRGKTKNSNHARSLGRLLCTTQDKNVDTSFSQIKVTRCNAVAANKNRYHHKITSTIRSNDTSYARSRDEEKQCGIILSNNDTSLIIPSNTRFEQPGINQSWCVGPSLSNSKHPHCSAASFQPLPNDDDTGCDGNSNYQTTNRPIPSRRFRQQSLRTFATSSAKLCYSEIGSDESSIHRFQQKSKETGAAETFATSKRNVSRFLRPRKNPWYMRSVDKSREGGSGIVFQGDCSADEYMERMMHAVVFVKEEYT
eukprot:jgi/Psemu1/285672/fgenesh1_pg.97_\